MAKQKRERVNRDFRYQDIAERLDEDDDVSFERIGDTIIMRRDEPERGLPEESKVYEEPKRLGRAEADLEDAEDKLILVKREIEKKRPRQISKKDYEELDEAFSKLERRLDSLEREFRSLRVELGYLKGVMLEKLRGAGSEEPLEEKAEYPKIEEVVVGKGEMQLVQEDIPEMTFEESRGGGTTLGFLTSTLSNIYNSLFLGAGETRDEYKEFQKKLFLLVRTQPRSLDEIAYGTEESKANCLIWLTRMVDEGLLEETFGMGSEGKKTYRIVWEKVH